MTNTTTAALPGIYIDGIWRYGNQLITVVDPSTEASLGAVSGGDGDSVEQAVQAATDAFPGWASSTGAARAEALRQLPKAWPSGANT